MAKAVLKKANIALNINKDLIMFACYTHLEAK